MTQGIRAWDASGQLILDITERISRIHGSYVVSPTVVLPPGGSYLYPVPGMTNDGTWFVDIPRGGLGSVIGSPVGFEVVNGGVLFTAAVGKNSNTNLNYRFVVLRG